MATNKQIEHLKDMLLTEQEQASNRIQQDKETVIEKSEREASEELSSYDNHPGDLGTELFEKERDMALTTHAESQSEKISEALNAIEDGSYGRCKTCGGDIPYERLEAVPTTLYCVEHTPKQQSTRDRPVEEEILIPSQGDHFENRRSNEINDKEDSFAEVARFGTSETPSDFTKDTANYDDLYETEDDTDGFPEKYEGYLGNDIDGKNRKAYPTNHQEHEEELLDKENKESKLGDIPYREKDSYLDKK